MSKSKKPPEFYCKQCCHVTGNWHGRRLLIGQFFGRDALGYFVTWGNLFLKGSKTYIKVWRPSPRVEGWRLMAEPYNPQKQSQLVALVVNCSNELKEKGLFCSPEPTPYSTHPRFKAEEREMQDCIRIHKSSGGMLAYRLNSCNL